MVNPIELGPIHILILTQLPTVAVIISIIGILLRILAWRRGLPDFKPPFKPLVWDILAMGRPLLRKGVISMWPVFWLMHLAFLLTFIGHLRAIGVWSVNWLTWLGISKEVLTEVFAITAGIIFAVTVFLILARKLISTKVLLPPSRLGDYLFIICLLLLVWVGTAMRFLPHTPGPLVFDILPGVAMTLDPIPQLDLLAVHALLAELLIMYFPYSRLVHIITGLTK
jgi:nitrate reductase gamma subunit